MLPVNRENLVTRTDLAYQSYQTWADDVLKFSYDASRSGSKLQTVPLRSALVWKIPPITSSKLQALPIRNARDWVVRSGLGGVESGVAVAGFNQPVVALEPTPLSGLSIFLIGLGVGWVAKEFLGK